MSGEQAKYDTWWNCNSSSKNNYLVFLSLRKQSFLLFNLSHYRIGMLHDFFWSNMNVPGMWLRVWYWYLGTTMILPVQDIRSDIR
jgi:hypothetical protein